MTPLQQTLFSMQDAAYRAFQIKLMPTVDPSSVIGIRTPLLRTYAKDISGKGDAEEFLLNLPHRYYEENNLHAFLLEHIKDPDVCITALDRFLPYVDNWATCDCMSPPVFRRHPDKLLPAIDRWLASKHVYTVRFAVVMLMRYFLDEHFSPDYPARVAATDTDPYYLHMVVAWYFATALAKQYEAVLPYLTEHRLAPRTHNKTITKACESYRLSPEKKAYLKILRI